MNPTWGILLPDIRTRSKLPYQLDTSEIVCSRTDFSVNYAFRAVDGDTEISQCLRNPRFLRRNGYSSTIQDSDEFIRRIDTDCDLRISFLN